MAWLPLCTSLLAARLGGARGLPSRLPSSPNMLQRPLSPVLLTREQGKNDKLGALLSAAGVPHEELPCISFERLQGCSELEASLQQGGFDWCIITSPESASVFLDSWKASGSPAVRIASVGAGTAQVLESAGLRSDFVPSKATGKMLAAELPVDSDGKHVVPPSLSGSL